MLRFCSCLPPELCSLHSPGFCWSERLPHLPKFRLPYPIIPPIISINVMQGAGLISLSDTPRIGPVETLTPSVVALSLSRYTISSLRLLSLEAILLIRQRRPAPDAGSTIRQPRLIGSAETWWAESGNT